MTVIYYHTTPGVSWEKLRTETPDGFFVDNERSERIAGCRSFTLRHVATGEWVLAYLMEGNGDERDGMAYFCWTDSPTPVRLLLDLAKALNVFIQAYKQ